MTNPDSDYLLSIQAVRETCTRIVGASRRNELKHFDLHEDKLDDVVKAVVSLIKRDYDSPSDMPPHGHWRHFDAGWPRIKVLLSNWGAGNVDKLEQTRRILDLLVIGVILDASFDHRWAYTDKQSRRSFKRSEGTAVATHDMFLDGKFSTDNTNPHRVDSEALCALTLETLKEGFQISDKNILVGLEDRLELLHHLGNVLQEEQAYFGRDGVSRPGNLMDYLLAHPKTTHTKNGALIQIETIWPVTLCLGELWSAKDGKCGTPDLGDVWYCEALGENKWVAFHKLSQWIMYSIIEPMEKIMSSVIEGKNELTPLPDAQGGGLLMDSGFLTLKEADQTRGLENYRQNALLPGQPKVEAAPMFELSDPVVIEWRALTVAYIEVVATHVREEMGLPSSITLSQLIEGGTSSAGQEYAEVSRPNTQEPPIVIKIDRRIVY